jgi:tRNA uridine 5-carboxymethylaminomethyl modification enzyme
MFMEDETLTLDPDMDYHAVQGLSAEVKERLSRVRPTNIVSVWSLTYAARDADGVRWRLQGTAKRMEGMTPSSIIYLLKHAKRTFRNADPLKAATDEVLSDGSLP